MLGIIDYAIEYGRENGIQVFISTIRTEGIDLAPNNHYMLKGKAINLFEEEGLV